LEYYHLLLAGARSVDEKVARLCEARSDEGYMAEFEDAGEGRLRLMENHCPICIAAQSCQGFCQSELDVFRELLADSATVEREDHLLRGARRCTYLITPIA
ncbi:MAG: transcriptional regulator, partial [Pseudomonadales bacterium]|nr:transcriptional regulator [Pseudomonadales bacterium]